MKNVSIGLILICVFSTFISCKKTSFIESPSARLSTSIDTVRFDTVFTTTGSITQSFKIHNENNQKLRLSNVKLMGGNASAFKLNVDGTPGILFTDIEIDANDSIYVFVSVSIDQSNANLPFLVQDSISINYNGNELLVQLEAFGQNAIFLRGIQVTQDSTWDNSLPIVILGSVTVNENTTLNISKGTKVFFHADAPMLVNGTLKVHGEMYDSTKVVFAGDRLDQYYRDFPGSWPGIYFSPTSKNNTLTYAILKNAYQGIIAVLPASSGGPKVTLNECILDNIYDVGILSISSNIAARNCLITNCGINIGIRGGGIYNFTHCTVVSYGNFYLDHKNPVLFISNANGPQISALTARFTNCIFWGEGGVVDNEIFVDSTVKASDVIFDHVLFKAKKVPIGIHIETLVNRSPLFDSINSNRRFFNFRLKSNSPAIDKGNLSTLGSNDLTGVLRVTTPPDLGCYENY